MVLHQMTALGEEFAVKPEALVQVGAAGGHLFKIVAGAKNCAFGGKHDEFYRFIFGGLVQGEEKAAHKIAGKRVACARPVERDGENGVLKGG